MNRSRTIVLSALLSLALPSARAMAADGWGSSYSFGPSTSRIIYAKTTLVPGRLAPITSGTGPLFLWPGMSNSTGDLIQTTMDAWQDNKGYCKAAAGQWCVEASVFGSFGQRNGPTVAVAPTDQVTIEYKLGTDGNTWTQTVTLACKVVSTLQSASGPMPGTGFGFATEADADSFTIDTQYYLNTEFHFFAADPNFAKTGVGGVGAKFGATGTGSGVGTAKNVHTPDSGLTWLVDLITLPAMQPQGTQSGVPTAAPSCSGTGGTSGMGGAAGTGGTAATGGNAGTVGGGGSTSTGGTRATGGSSAGGSSATGGSSVVGTAGGNVGSGGQPSTGGGSATTGGHSNTGGAIGAAGTSTGAGGAAAIGGTSASAGNVSTGGAQMTDGGDGSSAGSCSCGIPGKQGTRAGFGGGLALLGLSWLGFRRRRHAPARRGRARRVVLARRRPRLAEDS